MRNWNHLKSSNTDKQVINPHCKLLCSSLKRHFLYDPKMDHWYCEVGESRVQNCVQDTKSVNPSEVVPSETKIRLYTQKGQRICFCTFPKNSLNQKECDFIKWQFLKSLIIYSRNPKKMCLTWSVSFYLSYRFGNTVQMTFMILKS